MTTKKPRRSTESDGDSMFESDSSAAAEQETKRRRLNNDSKPRSDETKGGDEHIPGSIETNRTVDPALLEHAKQRLSKFAARLFDPNRKRGLVEAPAIIPLNDEILKAFGNREKHKYKEEVDHTIADEDEEGNDKGTTKKVAATKGKRSAPKKKEHVSTHKVKITNLNYRTTEEMLQSACLRFGDLTEVVMICDNPSSDSIHNSGTAYVTFDTEEGAKSCQERLKSLHGRDLRVSLALARSKKNTSGKPSGGSLLNNQSTKDISTVCFRCGEVGHREADCPNPRKPKPCPLCGMTDHDFRSCRKKQVCFNCGQPGHISRDCTMRRGLPRRMVCGTCFQSGHHRLQCHLQGPAPYVISDAICMDSGKRGRFLTKELKWFYGLQGMSCFNCGAQGHSGYDCNRPTLYHCINNPDQALQEIQRAEADSIAEELERERREQREKRGRGRNHQKGNDNKNKKRRAKSSGPNRRDKRGYR